MLEKRKREKGLNYPLSIPYPTIPPWSFSVPPLELGAALNWRRAWHSRDGCAGRRRSSSGARVEATLQRRGGGAAATERSRSNDEVVRRPGSRRSAADLQRLTGRPSAAGARGLPAGRRPSRQPPAAGGWEGAPSGG